MSANEFQHDPCALASSKLSPSTESKTLVQLSLIHMVHFLPGTPIVLPGHLTSVVLLRISSFIIYISKSWIPNGKMSKFQPLFSLKRLLCSYRNLWMQLDCFPKRECYPAPLSKVQMPLYWNMLGRGMTLTSTHQQLQSQSPCSSK